MKRKLKKRITAFLLCMVLVVCNSVSILADEPVATAVESAETKEQEKATKGEKAPEATTAAKEKTTEKAPETTTAKKEETTTEKAPEATTAKKEEKTTEKAPETTTAKKEETTTEKAPEATTAKKEETTTEKAPETTTEKTDNTEASTATEKETAPTELIYENDQVTVKVSAISEGAIPAGATLKVVPIEKENSQTKTAYQEVEKKIQEKATQEKYDIAGFLAYDITLMDKDGKEVEPNSEVKVTMDYKQAVAPAMTEEIVNNTNVSVLHLEENAEGQVKEVVDMNQNGQLKTMDTTAQKEIQKTEFVTNSFSVYTVTWNYYLKSYRINIHYIDSNEGSEINGKSETVNLKNSEWYIIEKPDIPSYTYAKTVIAEDKSAALKAEKTNISQVKATYERKQWTIKYKNGDNGTEKRWEEDETNIYVIYDKNVVVNPDPGTPQEPEMEILGTPEHHKYIDYHENGDNYTLTLDVSGKQGELTPVDILLIVDQSNSMNDSAGGNKTRKDNVNSAINTLKEGLKENAPQGVDINLGVVTFSAAGAGTNQIRDNDSDYDKEDDSADAWSQDWASLDKFSWKLSECTGGTNWQAGIKEGNTLLSKSENREKSRKYVIFLTDGEPTYRYWEGSSTVTQGKGEYNSQDTNNYDYAVKEWNKSTYLKAANGRYVIDATANGSDICKNFADDMGGKRLMGSDEKELKTAVDTIVSQITKPVYKNVSITDTLSDYVQLAENPEFQVKAQNTETGETLDSTEYTVEIYGGNDSVVYSGNTPNGANNVNWSDARKIKLQLTLGNTEGVLEDKIKYSISFKIKVKEDAARQAVSENNNQYPHIGDPDTDAPRNQTSSEKPGLYSNDNAKTHLTYQENENDPANVEYEKPVVQLKNLGEPVNFFLNLSSQILDTNGNTQGQDPDHFTTSVSGNKSALISDEGIGEAINEDLRVIVPENHNHAAIGQGTYPVIGGDTKDNALAADERIRDLQEGTTGNVSGTTEEYYKIVNGEGKGAFPTDEEIFTYIKRNWETQGTQGVNKGKNITVNGVAINKEYLTTDNFTIRWYVFKDQPGDKFWHIDGILVPKGGILTVTKTFPNQEIANNVNENFSIAVTGNFLTKDGSATISKNLEQAEKSLTNEDGSVTYSWQFAIFDTEYTVSESGYETTGIKWSYDSTDWSYTNSGGQITEGTTTSQLIYTEISEEDTEPVTQTFAFHNHYNASLNLKKVSAATGNPEISGAKFNLSEKSETGWTKLKEIVVNKNNTVAELNNLQTGKVYKLQEVEAPDSHVLLQEKIYFIVEASGAIKLCDEEGNPLGESDVPTMWWLDGTRTELTIKNEMLYELPSTGGNGIYWYTIGGMALMMGAALILYKDKRKRMVLLKR